MTNQLNCGPFNIYLHIHMLDAMTILFAARAFGTCAHRALRVLFRDMNILNTMTCYEIGMWGGHDACVHMRARLGRSLIRARPADQANYTLQCVNSRDSPVSSLAMHMPGSCSEVEPIRLSKCVPTRPPL